MRIRIPVVLVAIGGIALGIVTGRAASPWEWGPILGAVGESHVALSFKTSRPIDIDIHYGAASIVDATGTWEETLNVERHEGVAEIWLRDLAPGTHYRYQVILYEGDAVYPSDVGAFRTASASDRAVSFVVYGNSRSFPDRHKYVADVIADAEDTAAFVAHVGDLVESSSADPYTNAFWAIGRLARSRPFVAIVGDYAAGDPMYFTHLALPKGGGTDDEQWWSFDYGPVHVIGLDATLTGPEEAERMRQQTEWLADDLRRSGGQFIVVLSHRPLYGSGDPGGAHRELAREWGTLFREHGVDIVFSGAIGAYEHIYVDGIHHISTGGGGGPLEEPKTELAPGTVFRRSGMLHYMRVTVVDDAMRVEAIPVGCVIEDAILPSASGRSIDSFVLRRTP